MIVQSKFKPAWWLPGPHLQTLWPSLMRKKINLHLHRERIDLPDGDFIDLDWNDLQDPEAPIVLVLHGLEGSIQSSYARGLLLALQNIGYRAVLMHFRGCSGEHNRALRAYHSGETADLATIIELLKKREPNTPLYAVGYSLGGNVLLKWLGETQNSTLIEKAVSVSVPFELHKLADKMNSGFAKVYQNHLLKRLRKKFVSKYQEIDSPIDMQKISDAKSFWEFDNFATAPLHGFDNALDYYLKSSSRQYLKAIKTPTLIIHAANDPFMTTDVIPTEKELSNHVTLELSQGGGHVGFIYGILPGRSQYWLEKRIPKFLQDNL